MALFKIGHIPWNKGLKNVMNSWNKGLTKEIDERIRKVAMKRRGYKHSKKTRRKISTSQKGVKSWNTGLKKGDHPSIIRMGFKKGVSINVGKNHPNFKGWKSRELYGFEFNNKLKEQIRKRDNYECQERFKHQDELFKKVKNNKINKYKLHIHHINFDKKNNKEENLISLCNNCHTKTNFNREKWVKYYKKKIRGKRKW